MKHRSTGNVRRQFKALSLIASTVLASVITGCSERHHAQMYQPPSASTPSVTTSSAAPEVNISSFPVWAQNEYKAEQCLGKSKTALVSALGSPIQVEGGADDHSDIANKRLAYIYAGDAAADLSNYQVQVYFAADDNTPLTVAALGAGPTLGDVLTYLCGSNIMPTDLYCPTDPDANLTSYVYGKTRQGHGFIITLNKSPNSMIANYPKAFSTTTNQYTVGTPTLNIATWKQASSSIVCVFNNPNDVEPGAPIYVSRWFHTDGVRGLTHIKLD